MPAPVRATSIEDLWREAARASIAHGAVIDPPVDGLKRLTTPETAWTDIIPWPIDHAHDRLARMFDTHHLAIAYGDRDWLLQLHDAWDAAPWDDRAQSLRAQGEIALALAPDGPRRPGWSPEEVEELLEAGHLSPHIPNEHAWALLAAGDPAGAREALVTYDEKLPLDWDALAAADDVERRRLAAAPDRILRVESRALHALLDVGGAPAG
jgi:hypothetical protein